MNLTSWKSVIDMVKITRNNNSSKSVKAIDALKKAKMSDSGYNIGVVTDAIVAMFHEKCYICENKCLVSMSIDHLVPHRNDRDLKYDYDNLFLSCTHCNNIKGARYDKILDCTKVKVDDKIAFRAKGNILTGRQYYAEALENDSRVLETANLVNEVYTGNTCQKRFEAKNIIKLLNDEYVNFRSLLRDYKNSMGQIKEDSYYCIVRELREDSSFAGFKRWVIKDSQEEYPEFAEFL